MTDQPGSEHLRLVVSGQHTCDAVCLALYGDAYLLVPIPWWRRAWRSLRWPGARLGGLRLVHKDRIDQDRDDD